MSQFLRNDHTHEKTATISRFQVYERNPLYNPNRLSTPQEAMLFENAKQYNRKEPVHFLKSDPILQENIILTKQKPEKRKTELGDRKSCVFDMDSDVRLKVEQNWRPLVHKQILPDSKCYDENIKRQLKTVPVTTSRTYLRNPITEGDTKSLFNRKIRVAKENLPKDQFKF